MKNEFPRVNQLEGVKIMAYQYIQQNKTKLMNRISYLLMQHVVEQYQINEYFRFAIAGSVSIGKQIISDAIQLFMQQKIENKQKKIVSENEQKNKNQQTLINCNHQLQIDGLIVKNKELMQQNEQLRGTCEKERRKITKLLQKYNSLTEIMFEVKQKNQQIIRDITNNYELKLQQANNTNIQLRQHIARLDVTLQFATKNTNQFNHILIKSPTEYTMSCGNYEEKVTLTDFNLGIQPVLDLQISPQKKDLSLVSSQCQILYSAQKQSKRKNKLRLIKFDLQPIQSSAKSRTQPQTQSQEIQILNHFQSYIKVQENQQSNSVILDKQQHFTIQVGSQTQQIQSEQLIKCKEELKISNHLCQAYQKKLKQYKTDLTVLLSQKMELIKISNKCFEECQQKIQHFSQEISKLQAEKWDLSIKIQQLKQQKIDLLNLIQQNQVNTSHSLDTHEQIKSTENLYAQSDQTDQSSQQPRKDHQVYFQLHPQQKLTNSNQINEGYILKQTISRYFLQLMDNNCKGENKLVLLHQIGQCLGWQADQYERLQFYRQRIRLKSETPPINQPQSRETVNFKDRFYRFLTNESQTQE